MDKLQYLISTLEGKAAARLEGIGVISANFKIAWDKLIKRYDNNRKRLSKHLDTLTDLPTVRSRNLQDLENLMDIVEVSIRGLEDLGCDIKTYDNWFVHCIVKKLEKRGKFRRSQKRLFTLIKIWVHFGSTASIARSNSRTIRESYGGRFN